MAGGENLIPFNERTEEEQRAIAQMGGKASVEARRRKKAMRESLDILLGLKIKGKGKEFDLDEAKSWEGMKDKNITVEQAILVKQLQKALKGDLSAAAFIRDTSGQAPGQKVDLTGAVPVVISGEEGLKD